jgi:hypothetical protein
MNYAKQQMEKVKAELKPYLDKARENAAGSKVLDLETKINGPDHKEYSALQYTKKVSRTLNEERALEYLTSDAAFETALDTTPRVDQDGLWDLFVNDMIPQEVFDSFFDEKVTWAFTPIAE